MESIQLLSDDKLGQVGVIIELVQQGLDEVNAGLDSDNHVFSQHATASQPTRCTISIEVMILYSNVLVETRLFATCFTAWVATDIVRVETQKVTQPVRHKVRGCTTNTIRTLFRALNKIAPVLDHKA